MKTLKERADQLESQGVFLGGPAELFETAGRKLLITLLCEGLNPGSKVLDIGCGCLRGGYWLIHFLDKGCYHGIEPNEGMLKAGIEILLEPGLIESKSPRFDHNSDFNFSVFNEKFDFYAARSIWSHASKPQISAMLDSFAETSNRQAVFMTSYHRARRFGSDYGGPKWIGRSHESDSPGIVRHSFKWIQSECDTRDLSVCEVKDKAYNFGTQIWLRITHKV